MRAITLALLLLGALPVFAASGQITCTVRDAITGAGIPPAMGSWVDDYNQISFSLHRVGTLHIFNDAAVWTTSPRGGYVATGYATDYIPQTATDIQVSGMCTTTVQFYLYHPVLTLSIAPASIIEGGFTTGTVTLKNAASTVVSLRNALTINAGSGNGRVVVSQPAVIPAGSSSTTFTIYSLNNTIRDGNVVVPITVTSGTWGLATASVAVFDND